MKEAQGGWRNGGEDTIGELQKERQHRRLIHVKDSTEEWRSVITCAGKRLAYVLQLEMANLLCSGPGMEPCCI